MARERFGIQPLFEVLQLALGAPARQLAAFQGGDAGGIIAAVFEALERIDQMHRDRLAAEYADNSAHGAAVPSLDAGRNTTPAGFYPG